MYSMAMFRPALNDLQQWQLTSQQQQQQQAVRGSSESSESAATATEHYFNPAQMSAVDSSSSDPSNIVSRSMIIANGLDATAGGQSQYSAWTSSGLLYSELPPSIAVNTHAILSSTPPPDIATYPREQHAMFGSQTQLFSALPSQSIAQPPEYYLRGTSLEESPLSSPSSTDLNIQEEDVYRHASTLPISRSRSPLVDYQITATNAASSSAPSYEYSNGAYGMLPAEQPEHTMQKTVKMPQRKGGIQLWQFLYGLLTDADKKYKDIMEWTSKAQEREFRMLEPEAIAIWWGHHKNKPNMSYDKFSRSLRYYYDKGILRKIPGERYVYRFLIDPETMYQHIGISDCRPKLKPMPQAAKVAMNKFSKDQNLDFTAQNSPIVTAAPEQLNEGVCKPKSEPIDFRQSCSGSNTPVSSTLDMAPPPPPYPFDPKYTTVVTSSHSSGLALGSLATRRTRSLDYPSSHSDLASPQALPPFSPSSASLPAGIDFRSPYDIFSTSHSPVLSPNHSNIDSTTIDSFCESPVITTTDMELNYSDMIPFSSSEADMYLQSQLSYSYSSPQLSTSEFQLQQYPNPEVSYVSCQMWPHMNQ